MTRQIPAPDTGQLGLPGILPRCLFLISGHPSPCVPKQELGTVSSSGRCEQSPCPGCFLGSGKGLGWAPTGPPPWCPVPDAGGTAGLPKEHGWKASPPPSVGSQGVRAGGSQGHGGVVSLPLLPPAPSGHLHSPPGSQPGHRVQSPRPQGPSCLSTNPHFFSASSVSCAETSRCHTARTYRSAQGNSSTRTARPV